MCVHDVISYVFVRPSSWYFQQLHFFMSENVESYWKKQHSVTIIWQCCNTQQSISVSFFFLNQTRYFSLGKKNRTLIYLVLLLSYLWYNIVLPFAERRDVSYLGSTTYTICIQFLLKSCQQQVFEKYDPFLTYYIPLPCQQQYHFQ